MWTSAWKKDECLLRGCSRNRQQSVLRGTCEAGLQESPLQWERTQEAVHPQWLAVPAPGLFPIDHLVPPSAPKQKQVLAPTPGTLFLVLKDIWDATYPPLATCFRGTPLSF